MTQGYVAERGEGAKRSTALQNVCSVGQGSRWLQVSQQQQAAARGEGAKRPHAVQRNRVAVVVVVEAAGELGSLSCALFECSKEHGINRNISEFDVVRCASKTSAWHRNSQAARCKRCNRVHVSRLRVHCNAVEICGDNARMNAIAADACTRHHQQVLAQNQHGRVREVPVQRQREVEQARWRPVVEVCRVVQRERAAVGFAG